MHNRNEMRKLQFTGDATIEEIYEIHKRDIYNNVLKLIKENYQNLEINEIDVVKISTQSKDHVITLTRDKFIASLNRCITFFEQTEEYEKCQVCVNMINEINHLKKITSENGI